MEQTKFTLLLSYAVIATALSITVINLLIRGLRRQMLKKNVVPPSFGIWYSLLLLTLSVLSYTAFHQFNLALDVLLLRNPDQFWLECIKTASLYLGISYMVFVIWFYAIGLLNGIILGNRKDLPEIESNNYSYVLIKGVLLFSSVWLLVMPIENLLRLLGPRLEPLFH